PMTQKPTCFIRLPQDVVDGLIRIGGTPEEGIEKISQKLFTNPASGDKHPPVKFNGDGKQTEKRSKADRSLRDRKGSQGPEGGSQAKGNHLG
ncbi:MAG: hypothetical protein ACKOET_14675, partial [Verrucomicrobiota bacterium]